MGDDSNGIVNDDSGPSARKIYSKQLARQRERSDLTLVQLGEKLRYDQSYLFRLETGERLGSLDVARALDRYYDTGELLTELWRLAKREGPVSRYEGFMDVEAEAGDMQQFVAGVIPGLLQTERYARALLRTRKALTDEIVEQRVKQRMERQLRLYGKENLLSYRALIDEAALRRGTRDGEVWTEQLERLIHAAELPHVTLHVVPFAAGPNELLGGSLTLLWLSSGRNIAYLEGSASGQLIEDSEEVESLRLAYDHLRDYALSPEESLALIRTVLEDHTS